MDQVVAPRPVVTFNGPLEVGIRTVTILGAAYPRAFDLQRLIAFDYLLVHTGEVGGPDSLHPPAPLQSAELLVRRGVLEQALLLTMTRQLVTREASVAGFLYRAGENAIVFLDSMASEYLVELTRRASWLVKTFGNTSEPEFRRLMQTYLDRWVEEFQIAERSLGSNS
ncbi:MAG: ABC-three component system middle component 2 [Thermoanaerobaculia bacterium]